MWTTGVLPVENRFTKRGVIHNLLDLRRFAHISSTGYPHKFTELSTRGTRRKSNRPVVICYLCLPIPYAVEGIAYTRARVPNIMCHP